jgi:hypothetical protein
MALCVFEPLEGLNRSLQSKKQTVSGMILAVDSVVNELKSIRTDDDFNALLVTTNDVQVQFDLDILEVPRQRKPPARYTGPAPNATPQTVTEYYRPIYFALIDATCVKLSERFQNSAGLKKYSRLEHVLTSGIMDEDDNELLKTYPEISPVDLQSQLRMFHRNRDVSSVSDAVVHLQLMVPELRAVFSDVCALVRLLLVSPASSAEAERSFSALRRLKTWLRTTMTETRLNGVAVCQILRDRLDIIDKKPLLREFASRSPLRSQLFGQFL